MQHENISRGNGRAHVFKSGSLRGERYSVCAGQAIPVPCFVLGAARRVKGYCRRYIKGDDTVNKIKSAVSMIAAIGLLMNASAIKGEALKQEKEKYGEYKVIVAGWCDCEAPFDPESVRVFHRDAHRYAAPEKGSTVEIEFLGVTLTGEYTGSESYSPYVYYPEYEYQSDNGAEFCVDAYGRVSYCRFNGPGVKNAGEATVTAEDAAEKAKELLAGEIEGIEGYEAEVTEKEGGARFDIILTKYAGGMPSTEQIRLGMTSSGGIEWYRAPMRILPGEEKNTFDVRKAEESISLTLSEWNEYKEYGPLTWETEYVNFTAMGEDTPALLYCVRIQYVKPVYGAEFKCECMLLLFVTEY